VRVDSTADRMVSSAAAWERRRSMLGLCSFGVGCIIMGQRDSSFFAHLSSERAE